MTFVDYIIKERSRVFLSISLMDMDRSNYKGTLEEWFSDMYTEYKILIDQEGLGWFDLRTIEGFINWHFKNKPL